VEEEAAVEDAGLTTLMVDRLSCRHWERPPLRRPLAWEGPWRIYSRMYSVAKR
jgi:hypothetical protein